MRELRLASQAGLRAQMSIADLFCVVVPPGGPKIGATTYIKIGSSTHDEPRTLADNPSVNSSFGGRPNNRNSRGSRN